MVNNTIANTPLLLWGTCRLHVAQLRTEMIESRRAGRPCGVLGRRL